MNVAEVQANQLIFFVPKAIALHWVFLVVIHAITSFAGLAEIFLSLTNFVLTPYV